MQINEQHKQAIALALKSSIQLALHTDSICTACNYLHRFYRYIDHMKERSGPSQGETNDYDVGLVVTTSLYIACKTNENHVRISQLISSVHYHLGAEAKVKLNYNDPQMLTKDLNYWKLRDSVVQFELLMLRILGFNLTIDLPHKYLIFYLKSLGDWINNELLVEELFHLSWSLVNDYCCNHSQSSNWQPNQIALVCIELAIRTVSPKVKNLIENKQQSKFWYINFDKTIKQNAFDTILDQVLNVYTDLKSKQQAVIKGELYSP